MNSFVLKKLSDYNLDIENVKDKEITNYILTLIRIKYYNIDLLQTMIYGKYDKMNIYIANQSYNVYSIYSYRHETLTNYIDILNTNEEILKYRIKEIENVIKQVH